MRKKCKLQCVLKCHCCCHRQSSCYSFAILLPVSPRNPKVWLCLICWQLKLSRRLKVARLPLLVDWNPPYLTLPPDLSISASPNSYPSQWWHSILSDIYVLLWEWIMLLKPTPVVTYSISKAQSSPLTFTNPAIFFILLTWLLHKVEIYWNQRFPFRSRWKFRFTKSYALSSEVWPWFLLFFCPQSCTGPRYKTQY